MKVDDAAKELARDKLIIDSYTQYDRNRHLWVFTKNSDLYGITNKPKIPPRDSSPKSLMRWKEDLTIAQTKIIKDLMGDGNIEYSNFNSIIRALEKWENFYCVQYFGIEGFSCNLFVGETLFKAGKRCMNGNRKYFSAKEIWEGNAAFGVVKKNDVRPGDIAAIKQSHVEIVTEVSGNEFCAIGAGRSTALDSYIGGYRNGNIVCGWLLLHADRYIDNDNIRFRRAQ